MNKVKRLREITLLGVMECKQALLDSQGDFDRALEILRKRGVTVTEEKKGRKTLQGLIESYVHFSGNLGSLVEVNCETDFVAKNEVFKQFVKDLAMHVAATAPLYLSKEDIPCDKLSTISNLEEFTREKCLLNQYFIKDSSKTIEDYLKQVIAQTGENIVIRRFVRFSLGEYES
ncbi:MAG: elongation factor Ts [Candidatus Omnitrophica bacterium]|nr:elongation factor Ts [Candidatus Omnitrophota bacterium]